MSSRPRSPRPLTLGVPFRAGVSASCDTFYPGQERYDSFSGYVPRRFQGITEEWRRLHVLNYEMESSTVLTLTASMGLRGGCVAGVVVNRARSENVTKADLEIGESNAVRVAVAAVARLAAGSSHPCRADRRSGAGKGSAMSGVELRFLGTGDAFGSGGRLHTSDAHPVGRGERCWSIAGRPRWRLFAATRSTRTPSTPSF